MRHRQRTAKNWRFFGGFIGGFSLQVAVPIQYSRSNTGTSRVLPCVTQGKGKVGVEIGSYVLGAIPIP